MTRLRVVSHTGATSIVVLLLREQTVIENLGGSGTSSHGASSNVANNTFGSGSSPSRTVHLRNDPLAG
jgi:hypothetical protein